MQLTPEVIDVVQRALATMGERPSSLEKAIANAGETREVRVSAGLTWLCRHLATSERTVDPLWHAFGLAVRTWDRVEGTEAWTQASTAHERQRREVIYQRLAASPELMGLLETHLPRFIETQVPIVIADRHDAWYTEAMRSRRFYWTSYCNYLRTSRNWSVDSIDGLDDATNTVIERISSPFRSEIYASKGLVVGYVQSGKTAHFTGVLAKAADAGYKLIVVLAGTLDILRQQTQRRIDKELLGKELVGDDYLTDRDWDEFATHGGLPSVLGHFDWERLTGHKEDYQALKQGISALRFERFDKSKPFFAAQNLAVAPVRLVVIKKHPVVINRLTRDLKSSEGRLSLAEVPALVIDDESDQASLNTLAPSATALRQRTSTNLAITNLLKALPRAQYVGYTATPFANVLVNPDEAETLFPRDFIISLPRPGGYMGVSDFYDLEHEPEDFTSNKRAFVRPVAGDDDEPENLQKALDSFVLAGALKLYRHAKDKTRYRYEHHTMLIHISVLKMSQADQAHHVRNLFENAGYHSGKGLHRLRSLFESDFCLVSAAQEPTLPFPPTFEDVEPFVAQCLARLQADKTVRIVNGDFRDDTPNFDTGPIWSILVGGTKLSRGYTVEGLTTSYFRRVSTQSDTLMQMGRWFGFRAGYRDLVRLFIANDEPLSRKGQRLDLYEAFRAICLDEEEFRREILKYKDEGILPIQVPPFVPSHLDALKPTAKNKMYNAEITFKNLGGNSSEPTVAPTDKRAAARNETATLQLLSSISWDEGEFGGLNAAGSMTTFRAHFARIAPEPMLSYLRKYEWENGAEALKHQVAYLEGKEGSVGIERWLVLAPQLENADRFWPTRQIKGVPRFSVKERSRVLLKRFGVYSEPPHRTVAKYIAGFDIPATSVAGASIPAKVAGTAVMLLYPVRPASGEAFDTIGFSLYFPPNTLAKRLSYRTRRLGNAGAPPPVVIDLPR
jgi:hypothetical protein